MEHGKWQQELEAKAGAILPKNLLTVEVSMKPSTLLEDAAAVYAQESERVTRFVSNDKFIITSDEFYKYFTTLLYLRVARVNGTENSTTKLYKYDIRGYNVPAFIHTLLTSVGIAVDRDYGFKFIPSFEPDVSKLFGPEEMREISLKLSFLNIEGLTCVETGISMRPEGELSLMAVLNIEEEILSYKKDHPVYGFYASFFKHKVIDDVLNPSVLRIRYGVEQEYATYVRYIV